MAESHTPYLSPPNNRDFEHPNIARNFGVGVTIRSRFTGVALYAVYDGERQVSAEVGPLNDEELIAFAEGYTLGKTLNDS